MPGKNVQRELEFLVSAGLSPVQAINAATRHPAEFIRHADTLGTVEAGKVADLLIVDGNPLQDIRSIRNVWQVVKDGSVVDRAYHPDYANPLPRPPVGLLHANPVPRIQGITPRFARQDDEGAVVTVQGSGFIHQSVVVFDGSRVPTAFRNEETLEATIPTWLLGRAGTFSLWVTNPRPVRSLDWLHEDNRSNPAFFLIHFGRPNRPSARLG
jgi:hypothetical protein